MNNPPKMISPPANQLGSSCAGGVVGVVSSSTTSISSCCVWFVSVSLVIISFVSVSVLVWLLTISSSVLQSSGQFSLMSHIPSPHHVLVGLHVPCTQ